MEKDTNKTHNTMTTTCYRFICNRQVNFGEAVYILGNIQQLGGWDVTCAIRLDCYLSNFWICDVDIPIDTQIEYKYFISSFGHSCSTKLLEIEQKSWIGDENGMNFRLFLSQRNHHSIQQTRKTKNLKIMSFNIRCENKDDKDELHWTHRRQNCLEVINEHYPSIIGVQQARTSQKVYLKQNLKHLYNYIGVSRYAHKDDEEVGIFYDKQRFLVVEYGFRWISQTQKPGSIGFGARLPRYFTYIILEDIYTSEKFQKSLLQNKQQIPTWIPRNLIMVENVHLDHQSEFARKKGVQLLASQIEIKSQEYENQLNDIFVFGDFNTDEQTSIFHKFRQINPPLQSVRSYFEHRRQKDFCDYGSTFNGFIRSQKSFQIPQMIIDHMFIHTKVYKPLQFQVIRSMVHQPKNPKYCNVSDHYPILGIFKPNKEDF